MGLGESPDSVIAEKHGLYARKVCYIRNRLGIPAFVGVVLTQEGTPCRSVYEARYDAFLHWRGIEHRHEVPVLWGRYIADFYEREKVVEITGMIGVKYYDDRLARKKADYKAQGVSVVWMTPAQVNKIYELCPLPIKCRHERKCEACQKQTNDLVKNVCRPCYMKRWHSGGEQVVTCKGCGKEFNRIANSFCSRACYWKSLVSVSPSPAALCNRRMRGGLYEQRG
jgi:hypothetical protein